MLLYSFILASVQCITESPHFGYEYILVQHLHFPSIRHCYTIMDQMCQNLLWRNLYLHFLNCDRWLMRDWLLILIQQGRW